MSGAAPAAAAAPEMMNSLDVAAIKRTAGAIREGNFPKAKMTEATGAWRFDAENPDGVFTGTVTSGPVPLKVTTDQPPPAGGGGRAPTPVGYCVFAMLSCYTTTFVTIASMRGIKLKAVRARGGSEVSMAAVFDVEDGPVMTSVFVELEVEADGVDQATIDSIRDEASQKCPAAFVIQNKVSWNADVKLAKAS